MDALRDSVMTWLDPVGVVLGILIAIPVVWTWWDVVVGDRRRRRRWFREASRAPGRRPAILIVDLLPGKDVRTVVENFRSQEESLRGVPVERVVLVSRATRVEPEDMPALHRDLRNAAAQLLAAGADTIHYFHAGPASVAAVVGAEFANGCRVVVYQHETNGYRNFGPLRMEA